MAFDLAKSLMAFAALIYVGGMILSIYRFRHRKPPLSTINFTIVCVGFILQSIGLHLRGLDAGSCPIRDPFEVLQFISWSVVLVYLLTGPVFRLSFFGSISTTIAALLSGISFLNPAWDIPTRSNIFGDNPWIETHAALSLFSYGVFGILAASSILYLLQNYSLKLKRYPSFFNNLPSIYEMDQVIGRILLTGCLVFSSAMFIGMVHWVDNFDEVSITKLITTFVLWFAYLITLGLNRFTKLKSARLAWTCIFLFIFAILILWPIELSRTGNTPSTSPTSQLEE